MSYHKQAFSARSGAMGDEAEAIADRVFPKAQPFGLNRPNWSRKDWTDASLKTRYTPDRMLADRLIEVVGVGRDQKIKLKIEKLIALIQWSATDTVEIFIWDSHRKRWCCGGVDAFIDACFQHGSYDTFEEGKAFVGLPTKHCPYQWEDLHDP